MVEVRGQTAPPHARAQPAGETTQVVISDVWSRSGSKYRVRAGVLLGINMLLFVGLGCFAYWLRTGQHWAPGQEEYWATWWKTCLPGSQSGDTLTRLLMFPISLEVVPLQIIIHGMLLSALVSVPILVSILYRFWCCLPFVAVVGFVALMPWLALTLLGSSILASVRPFRFSFRYASALLGLVLVVIYIISVSLQSAPAASVLTNPGHRITLVAPWILAVLASCVLLGLGLSLARAVNYRPGAIAPLLAMMFALPIALFESYVGRDELYYRLLMHRYGPQSAHFQDQDVSETFDRAVETIHSTTKPERTYDQVASLESVRWQFELEATPNRQNLFARHREKSARDCDEFIKYFPHSRYAPAVLYLKGRTLDMRTDLARLRSGKRLVFYNTFPSVASWSTWKRLIANAPETPFATMGLLHLSILETRSGNVDGAIALLRELQDYRESATTTPRNPTTPGIRGLLQTAPPESGLQVPVEAIVFEGRRLLSLLENNRDPLYGDEPITGPAQPEAFPRLGWMLFDPRDPHYRDNLSALRERYPNCQLADNIEVELARTLSDPRPRLAALEACISKYTRGGETARGFRDAVPEGLYRLGETHFVLGQPEEARQALERVVSEFSDSIWRERAEHRLVMLGPVAPSPS
ncbi:MAG: tetratricopeptide repeat protein [bacterium]|nr:tetratricopeptide repeat protein [bacterium]